MLTTYKLSQVVLFGDRQTHSHSVTKHCS